jgi:hypothetical protein
VNHPETNQQNTTRAGLGLPAEHALISLLALNGLRVSEATSADIQNLGIERGHRTLVITCKGGKVVTIPLAPRTARAIDLAIGERLEGPIFLTAEGHRLDRHGAARIVRRAASWAGIVKRVGPTRCDTPSSPLRWMPGCRCAMCRKPPRMLIHAPPCAMTAPAPRWTGMRPILSLPMSPEQPGSLPITHSGGAGGERLVVTRRLAGVQGCHAPAQFGRDPRCQVRGRAAGAVFAR